jgi:protein gp37
MGRDTAISWTDATFNPWHGCTKVSPGCDNCYAETQDKRYGGEHWGKGQPRRVMSDDHWKQPLKWNREAQAAGKKLKVFCASMADVMDDEAPAGQRERLWDLIDQTPWLIYQLLTKRPHRYHRFLPESFKHQNVWLGTTAESQPFYDVRWPILQKVASSMGLVSFVSYEPAIGSLSMRRWPTSPNWIIFGGETGADSKRRPMELAWAENLRDECQASGTKFYMKQMSARTPDRAKDLIPVDMLIQQFPVHR